MSTGPWKAPLLQTMNFSGKKCTHDVCLNAGLVTTLGRTCFTSAMTLHFCDITR
eukprot:jgi/Botrbrau1/20639/Bobra.113_1s0063.1